MVSFEQKKKNKQYVLEHLEEYAIDSNGNYTNVAPDTEGDEWFFFFGKDSLTHQGYQEIQDKMFEMILREIKEWELDYYRDEITHSVNPMYFKHLASGRKIHKDGFDFEQSYKIIGELGYRKNIWENYEELKKWKEGRKKNQNQSPPPTNNSPPTSNQDPKNQNNPPSSQNKQDQPNKDNPPSPSDQKNNNLSTPADIQNNYNSDKDKSEIENNSNLTNPEQKDQDQGLQSTITNTKNQIQQVLKNHNLKNSCLPKQYQNWEEQLNKLVSKEEIISFSQEMIQKIKQNQKKGDNNKQPIPLYGKIFLGIVISSVILGVIIIPLQLVRRKKRLKRHQR